MSSFRQNRLGLVAALFLIAAFAIGLPALAAAAGDRCPSTSRSAALPADCPAMGSGPCCCASVASSSGSDESLGARHGCDCALKAPAPTPPIAIDAGTSVHADDAVALPFATPSNGRTACRTVFLPPATGPPSARLVPTTSPRAPPFA